MSHDWHGLVCGDEFWKYKLQHDYGFIDNTVNVPWRTWYYRVANSGALHTYNDNTGQTSVTCADNIYRMWTCSGRTYYLNLHGQLYYDNDYIPDVYEKWFGSRQICYEPPCYPEKIVTSHAGLFQIHNQAKCIIPTNYGDFILTENSELHVHTGVGSNLLATCVKMIYGNDYHLVYQTRELDLYYVELIRDKKLRSKLLLSGVVLVDGIRDYHDVFECDLLTTKWHVFRTLRHNHRTMSNPVIYQVYKNFYLVHCRSQKIIDTNVRTVLSPYKPIYIKHRLKL